MLLIMLPSCAFYVVLNKLQYQTANKGHRIGRFKIFYLSYQELVFVTCPSRIFIEIQEYTDEKELLNGWPHTHCITQQHK